MALRAFGASMLYRGFATHIERALRTLRPRHLPVPDLIHDAATKAILGLDAWRADCSIGTWLFRIAHNELRRRERTEQRRERLVSRLRQVPQDPSPATPDEVEAAREQYCVTAAALGRLGVRRRLCLLGLAVWDLGAEEVAALPGVGGTPAAVRQAASKGRAQLRRLLQHAPDLGRSPSGPAICTLQLAAHDCSAGLDGWRRCPLVMPCEVPLPGWVPAG